MTSDHSMARDRRLLVSGLSGLGARVAGLLASLASVAILARSLDAVAFGVVGTLTALVIYVNVMDFGVGNALMTRIAWLDGQDRHSEIWTLVSTSFRVLVAMGVVIGTTSAIVIVLSPIHRLLGAPSIPAGDLRLATLALTTSVAIGVPASIGSRVQVGLQDGKRDNLWFLAASTGSLTAVSFVAMVQGPIWAYVLAVAGTRTFVAVAQTCRVLAGSGVAVLSQAAPSARDPARTDFVRLARLFFVLQASVAIGYQSDVLVVSGIRGAATAALFIVALRMFSPIATVIAGASQQMWTATAEALARGDLAWVRTRFRRIVLLTVALATIACMPLVLAGEVLAEWWVGDALVPDRAVFILFAVWTIYSVGMGQVAYLLNAAEIVRPQVIMASAMTVANVAFSIVLTHAIGLTGPLWGSLAAHLLITAGPAIYLTVGVLRGRYIRSQNFTSERT